MSRPTLATSETEIVAAVADLGARMDGIEAGLTDHRRISEDGMKKLTGMIETMQGQLVVALARAAAADDRAVAMEKKLKIWQRTALSLALALLTGAAWLIDHLALVARIWPKQ